MILEVAVKVPLPEAQVPMVTQTTKATRKRAALKSRIAAPIEKPSVDPSCHTPSILVAAVQDPVTVATKKKSRESTSRTVAEASTDGIASADTNRGISTGKGKRARVVLPAVSIPITAPNHAAPTVPPVELEGENCYIVVSLDAAAASPETASSHPEATYMLVQMTESTENISSTQSPLTTSSEVKQDDNAARDIVMHAVNDPAYSVSERYDIMYDLCVRKYSFEKVHSRLGQYGFKSYTFMELESRQNDQDDFANGSCVIEEGIFTCGKCGCKKCFSFSKQTRSCDEGATVMNMCSVCRHRWIVRG